MKKKLTTLLGLLVLIAGLQFVMAPNSSLIGQTYRILVRQGLRANLPTLATGEFGFSTDTKELHIGSAVGNLRVMGDYITPEMYGAKGDGVTDDTVAIQAAVNVCLAVPDEPKVLCVAGQYRLTSSVNIDRSCAGGGQSTDFRIVGTGTRGGFYISTAINMFSSTIVDSDAPVSEFINFENVYFEGPDLDIAAHVLNGDKFLRTKFTGCRFFRVRLLSTDYYVQSIYVHGCTIKYIWGNFLDCGGAFDISFSGNLIEVVTGNVFKCSDPDKSLLGDLAGCHGFRFIDNLVEACLATPIVTDSELGSAIVGNYFEGNEGPQLDLCIGEKSNLGVVVSGNLFVLTPTQTADPDYYAIRWGWTTRAFSSGNFANGQMHDKTGAIGLVSTGDYERTSTIIVPDVQAETITNTDKELLTNGGFDSDADGWKPIRCTTDSVVDGQTGNCLEITYTSGLVNSAAYQAVATKPGESFSFSGYVKSGTSGDASYSVSIYDAAGNYEYKTINGTTTGSWVAFSDTFDNPSDNDAIRIYLVKNNVTAGTMLFDTISIKQIAPVAKANSFTMYSDDASSGHAVPHFRTEADGIIKLDQRIDTEASPNFYSLTTHSAHSETNGGFDSDASGWTGVRGTLASVAGGVDGNCLQLTETGGNINSAATQGVAVIPGATYSFSAWVKSGSAGNKTYEIVVYDEIYPANQLLFLTGTSSGSWVNRTGTFLAPVGFSNVNVYLIKDGTDAGTMLFDSVSVIQTIPDNPPADSCQQYSADAGAVAGQAGPHFRTEGGGIFGMRSDTGTTLQYVYQKDALADDGTVTLPDATSGMVLVSCNGEAGMWLVQADGTVKKISGSTNTAAADTDANLCVYDSGTGATVKNRLGATGEIRIVYYYN